MILSLLYASGACFLLYHIPKCLENCCRLRIRWKRSIEARPRQADPTVWVASRICIRLLSCDVKTQLGSKQADNHASRFCRFVGTVMGLPVSCILLWWYWPEAHGFVFHPLALFFVGTSVLCDLAYPFLLAYVRTTERVLPDGSLADGRRLTEAEKKHQ